MNKPFLILLLLSLTAYAQQQERVAIINTVDDLDSIRVADLIYLTDKLRETAVNVLPKQRYGVMTTESIVEFLGSQENAVKVCSEASCLAELGRKVSADYVAQARIGRFGNDLTIKTELYSSKSGNLIGSFTGSSKDVYGLLATIDQKAPDLFKKMPSVSGGISIVQTAGNDYEFTGGKTYLTNIATEPEGAVLSFNGVPDSRCVKTPCKAVLAEGSVRIVAALEQYERADTTVSIKQNNQNINIRLKANFGVLEIKPAYSESIGSSSKWSITINGKVSSSLNNKFSPGNYEVKLSHECYEDISFNAGINKDKREVFDIASYIKLKKGGLVLNAEKNGEPAVEPVYANGKQIGETPFSGTVPICAGIELGKNREKVDIKLKPNENVSHTVKMGGISGGTFTDSRDGKKYKAKKIGKQTWMAENLNYNASGSKCYENKENNCQKYGRLYNWNTAKTACPKGWHLPSNADWNVLMKSVNPSCLDNSTCAGAGTKLKATSGWDEDGNGEDAFGFSALPGGYGNSGGDFHSAGYDSRWWSASEYSSYDAYRRYIYYDDEGAYWDYSNKSGLFSVRCLQD